MTDKQAAYLIGTTLLSGGLIFLLMTFIIEHSRQKKNGACISRTIGTVTGYAYLQAESVFPVVQYCVNERVYQTRKKFYGIKTVSASGFPGTMKNDAWEDEKGWLHLRLDAIADLHQLGEKVWPLGSEMTVYYDPDDPKISYVDRPLNKDFMTWMWKLAGFIMVALSVLSFLIGISMH